MNRGIPSGLKRLWVPEYIGGGDSVNDGREIILDSTQPGGVKVKSPAAAVTYGGSQFTITGTNTSSDTAWQKAMTIAILSGLTVGQWVMAHWDGFDQTAAGSPPNGNGTFVTVVGGLMVNDFSSGTTLVANPGGGSYGFDGLLSSGTGYSVAQATGIKQLVSSDFDSSGNVTIALAVRWQGLASGTPTRNFIPQVSWAGRYMA